MNEYQLYELGKIATSNLDRQDTSGDASYLGIEYCTDKNGKAYTKSRWKVHYQAFDFNLKCIELHNSIAFENHCARNSYELVIYYFPNTDTIKLYLYVKRINVVLDTFIITDSCEKVVFRHHRTPCIAYKVSVNVEREVTKWKRMGLRQIMTNTFLGFASTIMPISLLYTYFFPNILTVHEEIERACIKTLAIDEIPVHIPISVARMHKTRKECIEFMSPKGLKPFEYYEKKYGIALEEFEKLCVSISKRDVIDLFDALEWMPEYARRQEFTFSFYSTSYNRRSLKKAIGNVTTTQTYNGYNLWASSNDCQIKTIVIHDTELNQRLVSKSVLNVFPLSNYGDIRKYQISNPPMARYDLNYPNNRTRIEYCE